MRTEQPQEPEALQDTEPEVILLPVVAAGIGGQLYDTTESVYCETQAGPEGWPLTHYFAMPTEDGLAPFAVEEGPDGSLLVRLVTQEELAEHAIVVAQHVGASIVEDLEAFLAECCDRAPDARVAPQALASAWLDWKKKRPAALWECSRLADLSVRDFPSLLRLYGFEQGRTGASGRFWKGIRLKKAGERPDGGTDVLGGDR